MELCLAVTGGNTYYIPDGSKRFLTLGSKSNKSNISPNINSKNIISPYLYNIKKYKKQCKHDSIEKQDCVSCDLYSFAFAFFSD